MLPAAQEPSQEGGERLKKWISVPAAVIADDRLTDPELRLLLTLIAKVGRRFLLSESVLTKLAMSERTFYRLSKNLMQCQYLQHTPGIPEYCVLLPIMTAGGDKVGNGECQSWQPQETEEERTKEEDIYNINIPTWRCLCQKTKFLYFIS